MTVEIYAALVLGAVLGCSIGSLLGAFFGIGIGALRQARVSKEQTQDFLKEMMGDSPNGEVYLTVAMGKTDQNFGLGDDDDDDGDEDPGVAPRFDFTSMFDFSPN